MKIRLTTQNAGSGRYVFINGARKTDSLRFVRHPEFNHLHVLELSKEEFQKRKKDIRLQLVDSQAEVEMDFEIEPSDLENAADVEALQQKVEELEAERDAAIANQGGITEEQQRFLDERDAILTKLLPFVEDPENDTPEQVLDRIFASIPKTRLPDSLKK